MDLAADNKGYRMIPAEHEKGGRDVSEEPGDEVMLTQQAAIRHIVSEEGLLQGV